MNIKHVVKAVERAGLRGKGWSNLKGGLDPSKQKLIKQSSLGKHNYHIYNCSLLWFGITSLVMLSITLSLSLSI